ncbi:MAG: hypothetical protein EB124_12530, partial [Betaproteobacteria bacterium]|nr:hypothetical protein [Betaproteobacteria bacterium]
MKTQNIPVTRTKARFSVVQTVQIKQTKYTKLLRTTTMSAAKSLTPDELDAVLAYIDTKPFA